MHSVQVAERQTRRDVDEETWSRSQREHLPGVRGEPTSWKESSRSSRVACRARVARTPPQPTPTQTEPSGPLGSGLGATELSPAPDSPPATTTPGPR